MAHLEYLYAIAERLPRRWRPPTHGVAGAPVGARRVEDLVAVASPLGAPPPRTVVSLAQHEDVVQTLLDAEALVPLGFGAAVADTEGWVRARLALVREALDRVRGSVEMRVRLLRLDAAVPDGTLAEVADRLLRSAALAPTRCCLARRAEDLTLAFLVPRSEVPAFLARIAPVAARAAGVAVVPSGPAPAYHFAPALGLPERAASEYAGPRARRGPCPGFLSTRWSA
ncbi:MAG TPA: GvpL/GvpF family gas vesicle protein [Calidithermus sp.]|jgi:hypothetical protein|nr:GvpL/GvpF family gas vesicle protein [Calidithermus sp.]